MNAEFVMGVVVTAIVIVGVLIMLVDEYRTTRPPATAYCPTAHPAFRPRIRPLGAAEYACHCPRCHDKAVIVANTETEARIEYAHHPCDPQ